MDQQTNYHVDHVNNDSMEKIEIIQNIDFKVSDGYNFTPIGYIQSMFKSKNGTPRQSGICNEMVAKLEIDSTLFNNPDHTIDGLENFSHVWLLFVFHKNNNRYTKAKVRPPRLNGKSQGVFATRSPYRFNPVGLTLAKITKIDGHVLHLSGIDIIDGTPIIDIKPYIEEYDYPKMVKSPSEILSSDDIDIKEDSFEITNSANSAKCIISNQCNNKKLKSEEESNPEDDKIKEASWIKNANKNLALKVRFTPTSENQLSVLSRFQDKNNEGSCDSFLNKMESFKESIRQILSADPRSSYRRNKCQDRLYFLTIDYVKLTCWFDEDTHTVEVLKVSEEES